MANTVSITQVQDGPSDVVYSYYFESDGNSGELTNSVILSPDWVKPVQGTQNLPAPYLKGKFNIQQIWYNLDGFDMILGFGSAKPSRVWLLCPSVDSYLDFRPIGGLADRTPVGDVPNGTIILNTNGFTSKGCVGSLILKVRKM